MRIGDLILTHACETAAPMRKPTSTSRAGVTLLEALLASAILLMSVLALTTAIAAGQAASLESQKLFLGSMAVDDLLSELSAVPYEDLPDYHELEQAPGALTTVDGVAYPDTFWPVGRRVEVTTVDIKETATGVIIRGRYVVVTAIDESRDLCAAALFIAEPAS